MSQLELLAERRIDLPEFQGIYVIVDAEDMRRGPYVASFDGEKEVAAEYVRWVHLMSRHSGGEIRGYALVEGRLHVRLPDYVGPWPEMDTAVARALGVELRPYDKPSTPFPEEQ